jgi:hypothetical protein
MSNALSYGRITKLEKVCVENQKGHGEAANELFGDFQTIL